MDEDFDSDAAREDDFEPWSLPPVIIQGLAVPLRFAYCDVRERVTIDRVVMVDHLLGHDLQRPTHFGGYDKKRRDTRTFLVTGVIEPRTHDGRYVNRLGGWLMEQANSQWLAARLLSKASWKDHKGGVMMVRRSKSGDMVYPHDATDDWWCAEP